jgi:transcription elongation factor Elf1
LTRRQRHASIGSRVPTALQFICNKCKALSNVQTFEQTRDGIVFCRCDHCGTKNKVVHAGQTPSQPGLLPVTGVIQ